MSCGGILRGYPTPVGFLLKTADRFEIKYSAFTTPWEGKRAPEKRLNIVPQDSRNTTNNKSGFILLIHSIVG